MKKQSLLLGLLFAAFSLMAQVPSYVPANGLAAWYSFTGNANDASGGNNNGVVNGATLSTGKLGQVNTAYSFNGSNNTINIPNPFLGGGQVNSFTLHTLVYFNSISNTPTIWGKTLFWGEIGFSVTNIGEVAFVFANSITGNKYSSIFSQPNMVQAGQWYDIVITFQNSIGQIYLNGSPITTNMQWSAQGGSILSTSQVEATCNFAQDAGSSKIGLRVNGGVPAAYLSGVIDAFGIWNRALNQQEITNLYTATNCTPPAATITSSGSTTFCAGNAVTLTAGGGNTYSWSTGSSNQSITVSNGATYTVTVTGANNCTATASQAVTVNPLPGNGVNVSGNTTFCSGGSVTLTAQGTGTYLWSNGSTVSSITVNQGGSYTVTVTSANNCTASSAPVNVTVNQTPTAGISAGGLTAFCQGGSVVLTASGGGSYNWNTGSSNQSITVTNGATYTVTVSNGNCTASATQNVTVYPTPSVSINPLPTFVSNNATPIPLSGTPAGGSYSGSGVSGSQFNPATAGLGSRSVTYTYNSPNNCTSSATTTTVVYDTTGTVCTDYDTVTTTIYDTTYVSLTTTDTLLIDFATGIAPPNNTNTLRVYPNPAKDHLIINNGNLSAMTGYSIKVTNALGQIVFNQPVNQQQFYIDLSTWGGSGVYVLYVLDSQQNLKETKQIVLQ